MPPVSRYTLELNELVEDSSQGGSTCLALVMATKIGMGYACWMAVSFVFQGFNV
jgi:hypothetical protein